MVQAHFSNFPFGLRKFLRTLRKLPFAFAQGLRSQVWVRITLVFSLGIGPAAFGGTEIPSQTLWSKPRFIQFNVGSQNFRMGPSAAHLSEWRRLPKPPGIFHGIRLIPRHDGHFMVLDEAQPRLCLYDTAGQWLSCLALPEGLKNRTVKRLDIVMRQDGRMVYIDADGGFAYLYDERSRGEAETQWQMLAKAPMVPGVQACMEKPWFTNLCCLRAKAPICFDNFLNPLPPPKTASMKRDSEVAPFAAWPDSFGLNWNFRIAAGIASPTGPTCFHSEQGFHPCP